MKRWMLLLMAMGSLIVACGHKDGDPTPGDDDDDDATGPALVTIAGLTPGEPAWVVLHDADGNVVSFQQTNEVGTALVELDGEYMISAVRHRAITTWTAVLPGDDLIAGSPLIPPDPFPPQVEVTLPGDYAGASSYTVSIGCTDLTVNGTAQPVSLDVDLRCDDEVVDVVAAARDGNGNALAISVLTDLTLSGPLTSVTLNAWDTALETVNLNLLNAPDYTAQVAGSLSALSGLLPFAVNSGGVQAATPGSNTTIAADVPPGFGDGALIGSGVMYDDGVSTSARLEVVTGSVPSGYTVDLSTDLLAQVTDGAIDDGDPDRPIITGTVPNGGDAATFTLAWDDANGDDWKWELHTPPGTATAPFPALPDELAEARPATLTGAIIEVEDYSYLDDYDAYRNDLQTIPDLGAVEFLQLSRTQIAP